MQTNLSAEPIRILIADDHTLFRKGLCALLNSIPDTAVAGEAATGDTERDWQQVLWIDPPPFEQYRAELIALGEGLNLV